MLKAQVLTVAAAVSPLSRQEFFELITRILKGSDEGELVAGQPVFLVPHDYENLEPSQYYDKSLGLAAVASLAVRLGVELGSEAQLRAAITDYASSRACAPFLCFEEGEVERVQKIAPDGYVYLSNSREGGLAVLPQE